MIFKRGVSEILGAVLIAIIVVSISAAYAFWGGSAAKQQTSGVVDLIRQAERSQRQLLSLTYYYKQGNTLELYIYNYGAETSTPKLMIADQQVVFWRTAWKFEWYEVTSSDGKFGAKLGESTYEGESFTFNWGSGAVYGGRSDYIGYVASTSMYFKGATTITISTDDGMEVYIDGQPVFGGSAWHLQGTTTYQQTVSLQPGTHEVVVKWYEWGSAAYSSFSASNVASGSISMKNMNTGAQCKTIDPMAFVEVTLNAPDSNKFDIIFVTEEGGVFTWQIAL